MGDATAREIIFNADILAEEYVPADIPGRAAQIDELKFCIRPLLKKSRPLNAWVYGKTGAGKTSVAKHLLAKLDTEAGISGVYVNCWEYGTLYAVVDKVAYDLRLLRAARSASVAKLEELMRRLGKKPFILVLDEIDKPAPKDRHNMLYNLLMLPWTGLICIGNSRRSLVELEDRVRTRLNPRIVEFKPYSDGDLLIILKQRAELSLTLDSWDEPLLKHIADLSQGNARIAIQTLRNAAILVESSGESSITTAHVDRVHSDVQHLEQNYALQRLNEHHRLLYEIIQEKKDIASGDLWRTYLMRCGERNIKPIASRTLSPYLNRLISCRLVEARPIQSWTKARRLKLVNGTTDNA